MIRSLSTVAGLGLAAIVAGPASAAEIRIDFTGFDLVYNDDGVVRNLENAETMGPGNDADSLASVDIFVDGSLVKSITGDTMPHAALDLVVNGPLSALGSTTVGVGTDTPQVNFQLSLDEQDSAGFGLALNGEATYYGFGSTGFLVVTAYNPVPNDGDASNDNYKANLVDLLLPALLPDGLLLSDTDDLVFSFTGNVRNVVVGANNIVASFEAGGAGVVSGVPEPASLAIAAAGLGLVLGRRRGA